jgi:transcriptional regulator with XRE-family HTH domain
MGQKQSIGETVKRLRMERGLKLKDLSKLSGISEAQISRLENGIRPPTMRMMVRLAKPLGRDGLDLVYEAGLMQ